MKLTSTSQVLNFPKKHQDVPDKLKRAELQLAVATCCHCSTAAIDHLSEVIKINGTGSTLENLRLHRTKCTALINSVVSPSLRDELISDMKGKKFSLMVDESTDVAVEKLLAVCARYFSEKSGEILTAFLGLYPVVQATGEALFLALTECLREHGLAFADCIGIACDGAAVMVGEHNSVWSRIKKESPNCVLNKCVCHSLALCVQKAFEVLPSNLGYLLVEIPGWFSHSTLRRKNYIKLFEALREEENEKSKLNLPFMKASSTRWLVRGRIIKRLLENWQELKAYFKCAMQEGSQEVRYKARTLCDMLHDDVNYFYFLFLSPIVLEFEKINAFFQSLNADPEKMHKELDLHHKALKSRVVNTQGQRLSIAMTDFGARFGNEIARCCKSDESIINETLALNMKQRCQDFLYALLREVENRLPGNQQLFQGLSALHPSKVLSQMARFPFEHLPFRHLLEGEQDVLEEQYRKILMHVWADESVFDSKVPDDCTLFWTGVLKYENVVGDKPYKELAMYALACLSCPVSNAAVERVFSQVTCIKTKYRNKMSIEMLDGIVRIRTTLSLKSGCCVQFLVTDDMLQRFTLEMYNSVE